MRRLPAEMNWAAGLEQQAHFRRATQGVGGRALRRARGQGRNRFWFLAP